MLRSYSKYIAVYILTVILICTSASRNHVISENEELSSGLPMRSDLGVYVQSLKNIVNFCIQHKNFLDLNFMFGLFLLNVNLKHTIKWSQRLPQLLINDFDDIFNKNDNLLNYFKQKMRMMNRNEQDEVDIMIASLFSNESMWSKRLHKFSTTSINLMKVDSLQQTRSTSLEWEKYWNDVNDFDKWTPSPKQSDMCMASLATNKNNKDRFPIRCETPEMCYDMLRNGTDFGYALQHRLLFMLIGHFARGCTTFSPKQDTILRVNFCNKAYIEAEYIALHDFEIVDLFLEQICLCTLDGHAQFLRRTWLSSILRYQKQNGCFGENLHRIPVPDYTEFQQAEEEWKLSKKDHSLLDGVCNAHLTSAATGAISAAIRYVIENYY